MALQKNYKNVDKVKFEKIKKAASAQGINMEGTDGTAKLFGVTLVWSWYDDKDEFFVVLKSTLMPETEAMGLVDQIITGA